MLRIAIINDTRPTHHYGCMLVMANLLDLLRRRDVEVVWTWPVSVDWRRHRRKLLSMPKVDAFIVNGEGTIHRSAERKYARALVEFARFAKNHLSTDCYLINATLYQNDSAAYQELACYKGIYVRDKASLEELRAHGLDGRYVPDLTLAMPAPVSDKTARGICVIDSANKSDRYHLREYAEKNGYDYRAMIVARPSNAGFFRHPRPFVKNIFRWLWSERRISTDPAVFIDYLKLHRLVITGRYHAVTMCLKNRIPFIALASNTPKISFLLQDALQDDSRQVKLSELEGLDPARWDHFSAREAQALDSFLANTEKEISAMLDSIIDDIRATSGRDQSTA